jgi:hypothetical protein
MAQNIINGQGFVGTVMNIWQGTTCVRLPSVTWYGVDIHYRYSRRFLRTVLNNLIIILLK